MSLKRACCCAAIVLAAIAPPLRAQSNTAEMLQREEHVMKGSPR